MVYSTRQELDIFISELAEIIAHPQIAGDDTWRIRMRSQFQRLKNELTELKNGEVEPTPDLYYRNGVNGLAIGIGYTMSAFAAFENVQVESGPFGEAEPVEAEILDARNLLWQGWSYTADGISRMVSQYDEVNDNSGTIS